MTGLTADLFHRESLWGVAGRDCAIRGAFSSSIHSAVVLPFQCWHVWGLEEEEGGDRIAVDGTPQGAALSPTRVCFVLSLHDNIFQSKFLDCLC